MIDRLPFIDHTQAQISFQRLNHIVQLRGLGVMEGRRATGKTRILEEFITNKLTTIQPDRIVLVKLQQTYRKTLLNEDSERIGSPTTLWLFDQLHYVFQRLALPKHSGQKKLVEVPAARIKTERAFSALYRKVLTGMQERRIRAVIIDNAHRMDAFAMEWLIALREAVHPQIAVIFCAQLQPDEQSSHTLNLAISNVPTVRDSLVDRFQLAELGFDQFHESVFDQFLSTLQLQLDKAYTSNLSQLGDLVTTVWSWSQGNWVLLDRVGRLILGEYQDLAPPYRLTPRTMERVKGKLSQLADETPTLI